MEGPSRFIAGNVGGFFSGVGGFEKITNSRVVFAFGGSFGMPLSSQLYLYAKFTYFTKSVVVTSTLYHNYYGQPLTTPESVVGTRRFWQLVSNYGVLQRILNSREIGVEMNGGLVYSIFSSVPENLMPGGSAPTSPVSSHNAAGIFAGIMLEHQFTPTPFSTFVEAQYDYLWPIGSSSVVSYGSFNVSGGVRFYLKTL